MPKTVTLTIGPADGASDSAAGLEETETKITRSGLLQMLIDSHVCVDRKKDKTLKGKIQLYISDAETEFKIADICDDSGNMTEKIRSELQEWIYTHVTNQ
jgi:hypothetical protein